MTKKVYPVAGRYLLDVPHVAHECSDPRCVESGAFTHDPPPKVADIPTKGPANAGPSDSTEAS